MSKKIKLTESQLKSIVNVISEDTYDQALMTHLREKSREVFMSNENAKLLYNLSSKWCETRVTHPECEELETLVKKLKLERL